jgi:hypothetical protein
MNQINYTSLSTSKLLDEAGFTAETDAWWEARWIDKNPTEYYLSQSSIGLQGGQGVPAFSAQTLLDRLPADVEDESLMLYKLVDGGFYVKYNKKDWPCVAKSMTEALGLMALELIKKGIKL